MGKIEISSKIVGEAVMKKLMEIDRIAYIRFASVYREFADIESFKQEIDALSPGMESRSHPAQLPLMPRGEHNNISSRRNNIKPKKKTHGGSYA
jgi:hypothetical protein